MRPTNGVFLANGVAALLVLWLYGGDALDYRRALSSGVAAMTEPPNVRYALAALGALAVCLGVFGYGLARRRGNAFKGFRLLPIVAVLALFGDLFVVSADKIPIRSSDHLSVVMDHFGRAATALSSPTHVVTDERALRELLPKLGQPPYLVNGARPETYQLQVRQGCAEPVADAPGVAAITLIYCSTPDRKRAFVTAVALPAGQRFGDPQVFTDDGLVQWAAVHPSAPEQPPKPEEPRPFEREGAPESTP